MSPTRVSIGRVGVLSNPQGKVYAPIEWDLTKPLEGQPEGLDERITAGSL